MKSHPEFIIAHGNFCSWLRLPHKELKLLGNYIPKRINALEESGRTSL